MTVVVIIAIIRLRRKTIFIESSSFCSVFAAPG
jgi:hypothetical protein